MANELPQERRDQVTGALSLIYEHIKLADQKALVFIALNVSMVGAMYSLNTLTAAGWERGLTLFAYVALLSATALALWTIKPRRGRHSTSVGAFDPARIVQFREFDGYLDHLRSADAEQLDRELAQRVYDLCKIDRTKYVSLGSAIGLSVLGWLFALSVLWLHASAGIAST